MGLLNSALQIGRSAILSYSGALHAVGNNVSNAGAPDYTRLSPQLDPVQGVAINGDVQPGAGVTLSDILRNVDEALESRVRTAIGVQVNAASQREALAQVETYFDDLNGTGVGAQLQGFFHTFDELQNTPEDLAVRDLTIAGGVQMAESMKGLRRQLISLGASIDSQISQSVEIADRIATEVAALNSQITSSEAGDRGQANSLRDRRDALLRELSQYFDVAVREQPDGALNVYVGGEALIQGNFKRDLVAVVQNDGEFVRSSVRFADTNQQVLVRSGRIGGLMQAREEHAYGRIAALDELAAGVIAEVNRLHVDGQGLQGFRDVTGAYDLLSSSLPLDSGAAGAVAQVQSGSFYITVLDDATQTPVAHRIDVTLDGTSTGTTLASLVQAINDEVDGVTAEVTGDNRLNIQADAGSSFVFGFDGQEARPDTSGVLAALGVNTFFTGRDASDIDVNEALKGDPSRLAASSVYLAGEATVAGRIASLDSAVSSILGGVSIPEFYNAMAGDVAVTAASANEAVKAADTVSSSLQAQRESVSGVNLDEEAIALLKYERAFQGAARFVTVVDQLLGEVVSLIR
jgi:flagellar hook-associated protein 1